jgi:hypothetical protein
MTPAKRPPRRPLVTALAVLGLLLPATAWTWGSVAHRYIASRYSQHLPAHIDGLRLYDSVVYDHVNDPDARKSYTPGEAERHYIDIDYYPEFFSGTLPRERSELEALHGAATVFSMGVLPWAVTEVVDSLTRRFQAQQWSAAALMIADLCHYVGDATQPLHVTLNYNGQLTGNTGIHSRYESTMISTYLGQLATPPMDVTDYASPLDAIFDAIEVSWAGVAPILAADNTAKAASGGSYNSTYYASLWNSTRVLTQQQLDAATVMTASYVLTAWQDAGRPTVPGSSAEVPPSAGPVVRLIAGPSPCRDLLTVRFAGTGPLSVEVFDVRGARVARLADGVTGEGSVTWRPGASGAGPGLYFVRLRGPAVNLVQRVSVIG